MGLYPIFTADALKIYINDGKQFKLLWSSTAANTYSRWLASTARLDHIRAHTFSLVFHVRYVKGCRNSVGIDDIKFHQCPAGMWNHSHLITFH